MNESAGTPGLSLSAERLLIEAEQEVESALRCLRESDAVETPEPRRRDLLASGFESAQAAFDKLNAYDENHPRKGLTRFFLGRSEADRYAGELRQTIGGAVALYTAKGKTLGLL